jgi:hypothetical protein
LHVFIFFSTPGEAGMSLRRDLPVKDVRCMAGKERSKRPSLVRIKPSREAK